MNDDNNSNPDKPEDFSVDKLAVRDLDNGAQDIGGIISDIQSSHEPSDGQVLKEINEITYGHCFKASTKAEPKYIWTGPTQGWSVLNQAPKVRREVQLQHYFRNLPHSLTPNVPDFAGLYVDVFFQPPKSTLGEITDSAYLLLRFRSGTSKTATEVFMEAELPGAKNEDVEDIIRYTLLPQADVLLENYLKSPLNKSL